MRIFFTLTLLFALFPGNSVCLGQQVVPPPNVLFIAVDDLKPNLGCYGDQLAITPAIDRIAAQGTVMTANYCQQAICAPSRISLFTGMRPDYTGVMDLRTNMRDVQPEILTIPEYFKLHGYATVGVGKLMHGARDNDPRSWTIPYKQNPDLDYADGFSYPANGRYQDDKAQEWFNYAKDHQLSWKESNDLMRLKDVSPATEFLNIPDNAYTDGAIAEEGLRLLEKFRVEQQPFFLAIGFMKPHLPFVAPKKYHDMYHDTNFRLHPFQEEAENSPGYAYSTWGELRGYSGIPGSGQLKASKQLELIRGYYACISYVDAQIGRLVDRLVALGLADNTIIIIWGDHGWHLGDHGLWCKHTNFEQATRAPLIIVDPRFESIKTTAAMTEFVDIFPTLCDLAGLQIPQHLHGSSLVPLMKHHGASVKDYAISQYPRGEVMGYSIRDPHYRLTWWIEKGCPEKPDYDIVARELYDYKEDYYETRSLSGDEKYTQIESALSNELEKYIKAAHQFRSP